jgi:hypothetical protein
MEQARHTKHVSISVNSHHLFSRKHSASQSSSFILEAAERMSGLVQSSGPAEEGERRRGSVVPAFEPVEEGTPTEENEDLEKGGESVDNVREFNRKISNKSIVPYESKDSDSDE